MTALQTCGWSVERLSIEDGPDLLIGRDGETHLVECKSGKKKLKPRQADWHARWRGAPVKVFRTIDDAMMFSKARRLRQVFRDSLVGPYLWPSRPLNGS